MARLCALKILLLWAAIIGLSKCNNTLTAPPPANISPTNAPTSNTSLSHPSTTQTQSTAPSTQPNTTVTSATKATAVNCSYTVTLSLSGLKFDMSNNVNGTFSLHLSEEGTTTTVKHELDNQTTSFEIKHLKPCTEYEHTVTFRTLGPVSEVKCNLTSADHKTRTNSLRKMEINAENCKPGFICYDSNWNITSLLSTPNSVRVEQCSSDNRTACVRLDKTDVCTNFTSEFISKKCNSSFTVTSTITIDYLDPKSITFIRPTKLPAEIKPDLPNCGHLKSVYTCSEQNLTERKKLTDLEPFTDYTCTGQLKDDNKTLNTTDIKFRIDCDLIITPKNTTTNTSIYLNWTTTSQNCPNNIYLQNLMYHCNCQPKNERNHQDNWKTGKTCSFEGLQPFTEYTCEIQPNYNKQKVSKIKTFDVKTDVGVPQDIGSVKTSVHGQNTIQVKCDYKDNDFNGPKPNKPYNATLYYKDGSKVLQESSKICHFEFKDLSYSTSYTVKVVAFNVRFHSNPVINNIDTKYNDKAVIGVLVFLIICTSVALLLVLYKIYILRSKTSNERDDYLLPILSGNDEDNLLSIEPIAAEVMLETYKRKIADEGRLFLAEFQSIPRIFSRHTVKEAKKTCNGPKNRYVDILPYDYNRVHLDTGNGEAGCDYINASFIDGYKEPKKYIAAQGPKEETVGDFWRMIWEQQSSIIVMVTRCEEGNRVKCAQYWPSPERETEIYEEFIVKLSAEDHCPDYIIRHLSLTNKREKNSEREVTHIQFTSWPDHGVPGEPHLLLKLRRRVNAFKNLFSGPIVVHCSAGVGRTGTYIGIDAMMEGLEAEGRVDIYGYIVKLRKQRCLMVQVEAQYILIHQALLEHHQFGETEIILPELHSSLNTLKQRSSSNEPNLMEEEFDRIPSYKNWRTCNTGLTEDNQKLNRCSDVIPYDYNRVLVKLEEARSQNSVPDDYDEEDEEESSDEDDEDSTKYINATQLDGYWGPRALIAAQTPLPGAMADFWMMVYQKKTSTIVMLSDCKEDDKESDCVYWSKDKKTFGEIEVEVMSADASPAFVRRSMLIRHVKRKESRPVKQFQFLKWGDGVVPEKPQELTDMAQRIREGGGGKSQRNVPIVVHCDDGSTRSGVFCALWNLLDSAETEKLVDVFQVSKTLRKERKAMISSLEQYQFLYEALEGVFPVQNGEVKAAQAPTADSVQIVNETHAAEQPAQATGTTGDEQQVAAESTPLVSAEPKDSEKEAPTETTPLEDDTTVPPSP
ncbi:receptor-type tyrosine-protein phosphatase C isoform X2 [Betta splendens]|uniref:Receptor-type tyrosine-protein phosphatase C n=1 Tax=Betta splendens TaxID=158456 RepID=A0A6P7M578_BETSP|nr:receptor-type tyrosine-protein phosphatase C isoform X2 [Betta splendens]